MKLSRLPVVVAILAALTVPASGQAASFTARQLSDVHVGPTKAEVRAQKAYSNYVLEHFKQKQHRWKLLPRHATCWSHVQSRLLRRTCDRARRRYAAHLWLYEKADAIWQAKYAPKPLVAAMPGEAAWYADGATQCEVSHEGAFTSVSPDGIYAGRFQMDSAFEASTPFGAQMQRQFGRASHWPEAAQIHHAYEVWLSRGWSPWPPYYVYGCSRYHGRSYP